MRAVATSPEAPNVSTRQSRRRSQVKLGPLRYYVAFQLRRAQDVSFQVFARDVGQADLGPGRYALLAIINENPGLNQTLLGLASGRDKSSLTPALRDLGKRKFISRKRSETDARANVIYLTAAGKEYLARLTKHAEAHDRLLDSIVGSFHKRLLIQLLEQIVDKLAQELDQPGE